MELSAFLRIFALDMDLSDKQKLKKELVRRLKKANAFWSYRQDSIKDVPDHILVELVMLHLDLDDIDKLFQIYTYKFVKTSDEGIYPLDGVTITFVSGKVIFRES